LNQLRQSEKSDHKVEKVGLLSQSFIPCFLKQIRQIMLQT